jgi:hypothetical protein
MISQISLLLFAQRDNLGHVCAYGEMIGDYSKKLGSNGKEANSKLPLGDGAE